MKKLNEFEAWFLKQAGANFVEQAEEDVKNAENDGKRSLFAPGYFTMVWKEISAHIDDLTNKPRKLR